MKFLKFISQGFGCLPDGFELSFPEEGLILILGDNEQGKSTLVNGLLSGLYGAPKGRNELSFFKDRVSPWDKPEQGGRLILEVLTESHEKRTIIRDFGAKGNALQVMDSYSRQDLTEQYRIDRKTYHVGENPEILGLSRTVFEKSAFLSQNSLQDFENTGDLVLAIEKMVESGESGVTAQAALKRLQDAYHQRNPLGGRPIQLSTILSRISSEIVDLERQEKELLVELQRYQKSFQEADELREQITKTEASLETATLRLQLAEMIEYQTFIKEQAQIREQIKILQQQREPIAHLASFPIDLQSRIEIHYGQWQQIQEDLSKRQNEIDVLTQRIDAATRYIETYGFPWESFSLEDGDSLRRQLSELDQSMASTQVELEACLAQARQEDIDIQLYLKLKTMLKNLPLENLQALQTLASSHSSESATLTDLQNQRLTLEADISDLSRQVRRIQKTLWSLLSLGVSSLICFLLPDLALKNVGLGVAFLLFLTTIILYFKSKPTCRQHDYCKQRLEDIRPSERHAHDAQESHIQTAVQWLQPLNLNKSPAEMQDLLKDLAWFFESRQQAMAPFEKHYQTLQIYEQGFETTYRRLCELLNQPAPDTTSGNLDFSRTQTLMAAYSKFRDALSDLRSLQSKLEDHLTRQATSQKDLEACQHTLFEMLSQAEIPIENSNLPDALLKLKASAQGFRGLQELNAKMTTQEALLQPESRFEAYQAHIEARKHFLDKPVPEDLKSLEEERKRYEVFRQTLSDMKSKLHDLEVVINQKRDGYNQNYPRIQEDLKEKKEFFKKYSAFERARTIAESTLTQVSQESYHQWAERLNTRVNDYLKLLGSPYTDLKFGQDLSFSFYAPQNQLIRQNEKFQSLSHGAKDLIYLAVRFAVCDYLSQTHGHLPLILDDPFTNLDDNRFQQAFGALLNLASQGKQVLMFSCHKQRYLNIYQNLQKDAPKTLYLQYLERSPLTVAR